METPLNTVKTNILAWVDTIEIPVDIVIISFDEQFVRDILISLLESKKIKRIVLPTSFPVKDIFSTNQRIVTTRTFLSQPDYCIFIGDFIKSHYMTNLGFDYFSKVDREPAYRKYCLSICMLNFQGSPPLNSYWVLNPDMTVMDENFKLFFLKKSEWALLCTSKPKVTFEQGEMVLLENVEVTKNWLENLRNLIRHFVPTILGTDEYTEEIVSDENMICWVKCFIHKTYNYIYSYDGLEFVGDGIFDKTFRVFMYGKYPRMQAGEATNYKTEYVSRDYMAIWSSDMSLEVFTLAHSCFEHNLKTRGDLFESFFAALFQTCSSINPVLGDIATQNLTNIIGETLTFEKKIGFGRDQHRIEQIFAASDMKAHYKVVFTAPGMKGLDDEDYEGPKQGDKDVKNSYKLVGDAKFNEYMNKLAQNTGNANEFLSVLSPYEFSPYEEKQQTAKAKFWNRTATIFERFKIDMQYIKSQKEFNMSPIDYLNQYDNTLMIEAKTKLAEIMKIEPSETAKFVHFDLSKEERYIIMYIYTDVVCPGSKLLGSLTVYNGGTTSVSDDYYTPMKSYYQIQNLAVVPFPLYKGDVNNMELTPKNLGIYNAIYLFVKGFQRNV